MEPKGPSGSSSSEPILINQPISTLLSLTDTLEQTVHHLIDVDLVFLHVVPIVDLASFNELHGQNPIGR